MDLERRSQLLHNSKAWLYFAQDKTRDHDHWRGRVEQVLEALIELVEDAPDVISLPRSKAEIDRWMKRCPIGYSVSKVGKADWEL